MEAAIKNLSEQKSQVNLNLESLVGSIGKTQPWKQEIKASEWQVELYQASAAEEIIKRIQNSIHGFVKGKLALYLIWRSRVLLIFLK